MKTTTKKKVGLISAGLVLVAILIGSNYSYNASRTLPGELSKTDASQQAGTSATSMTTPAIDNTPVSDAEPVAARRVVHHHAIARKTPKKAVADMGLRTSADHAALAMNNTVPPAEMTHETSKYHYGHVPANIRYQEDGVTKMNHRVHLGIVGGYNLNDLTHAPSSIPRGGYHAGGIMDVAFGQHFALQPAVLYSVKGTRFQSMRDVANKESLRLNYLEVPINAVFKIGSINNTQFLIGAGPYFSYLLNAKDNFQSSNTIDGTPVDVVGYVPETPNYQTSRLCNFDYGVGAFLGVQSPDGLFMKAGGELGMTDVQESAPNHYRNYNLMVSAGYLFGY